MCDTGLKEHSSPMITLTFTGQAHRPRHWLLLLSWVLLTSNVLIQSALVSASPAPAVPTGSGGISVETVSNTACPPEDEIAPCRCMVRAEELQLWCSHSDLATVQAALRAVSRAAPARLIDELILENNALGAGVLGAGPGAGPAVARLMLRDNGLERVPAGWLAGLEHSLVELFVVEPLLRGLPDDSLLPFRRLEALTLQCGAMQTLPRLSGLPRLRYLFVRSPVLWQVPFDHLRALPSLEQLHVVESPRLTTLDAGVLSDLPRLATFNVTSCGLTWLHQRSLQRLPALSSILLTGNRLADAAALGRALGGLPALAQLFLQDNALEQLPEASFTLLPALRDLSLSGNRITEIHRAALSALPALRTVDMSRNQLRMLHPDAFQNTPLLEELWLQDNALDTGSAIASLLTALPRLRFLDLSRNRVGEIAREDIAPHNTLERLHLDGNRLRRVFRGSLSGLPALRELRLADNLLTNNLDLPLWNLPALKGLDLARNQFRRCDSRLLAHLPSLRRLDLSDNSISMVDPDAFLGSPALEHVNLSGNALASLPSGSFSTLRGLFELDVGRNRLASFVPGLPPGLEYLRLPVNQITELPPPGSPDLQLPALRLLDLSSNGLRTLEPDGLRQLRGLQQLLIAGNALADLPAGALSGLPRLERLDLKSNRLSGLGPHSLAGLRALRRLDLRDNRLEQLPSAVLGDAPALEELDVSSNQLAELHPDALRENRMLRSLRASHNALSELPEALKRAPALRVLDMSANRLAALSPGALSGMPALQELHLGRNRIRELPQGALEKLPGLKHLDMSGNQLQALGPKALNALPALEQLVLANNRITSLAPGALTDTPVLVAAQFQHNALREVKPGALAGAPSLQLLNLSYNQLGALDAAGLSGLRKLEVLDLSHNRVSRLQAPPASLDGLVELKMDHNLICSVSTLPFSRMARLKVLSLSDNRVQSLPDDAVMRLRANDGRVEVSGNPLWCSCEALQLHNWLTEAPAAGDAPRCSDGSPLRELRVSRQDCTIGGPGMAGLRAAVPPPPQGCDAPVDVESNPPPPLRNTVGGSGSTSQVISAALEVHNSPQITPLKNQVTPGLPPGAAGQPQLPPTPEDSEYFYEDFVEYPTMDNSSGAANQSSQKTSPNSASATQSLSETPSSTPSYQGTVTSMTVTSGPVGVVSSHYIPGDTPTVYAGTRKPTTVMTTPRPPTPPPPSPGGLMFFGIPLKMPSLSFFGAGRGADGRSAPQNAVPSDLATETATTSPGGTSVNPSTLAVTETAKTQPPRTTGVDLGTTTAGSPKTALDGTITTPQVGQTSPADPTDLTNKPRVISDIFNRNTPNAGTAGNPVFSSGFTTTSKVASTILPSTENQGHVTGTVVRVTPTTGGFTPILPGGGVFRHDSATPGPPTFGGPIVVTESYNIKDGHEESIRLHSSSEEAVHVRTSYRRPSSGSLDEDNLVEVLAVTPGPPSSIDIEQAIVYNLGESAPASTVLPAQQVSTVVPSTAAVGSTGYTGATWTKAVTGVLGVSGPPRTTGTDFTATASPGTTGITAAGSAGSTWTAGTTGPAGTTGSVGSWTSSTSAGTTNAAGSTWPAGSAGTTNQAGSTWPDGTTGTTVTTEGATLLVTSTKSPLGATGSTNTWSTGFTGGRVTATPVSTVTISGTNDPDGTTSTNLETRGSSLSALLAPGGQLSSATNQGRSRLASGPPPSLSQTDEPGSAPIPRSAKGPHYYYAEASPEDVQASRQAHNWYFENYNRTNLKPYVGPGKEAFSRRSCSQRPFTNSIIASLTPLLTISTVFRLRIF